MPKYDPLSDYLRRQTAPEIRMSFEQIERVIGSKLPPKAQLHRAWWSNSPSNSVMTKAWLEAGYRSERVDIAARKLVFKKVRAAPRGTAGSAVDASGSGEGTTHTHPLFGWLKDTARVAPGVDLTEPADPEWGAAV